MKRQRPPSKLTLAVLSQLAGAPQYGYGLMQETGIKSGTLYPILMRLTDRGLLRCEVQAPEASGRPARRIYHLTGAGRDYAAKYSGDAQNPSGVTA